MCGFVMNFLRFSVRKMLNGQPGNGQFHIRKLVAFVVLFSLCVFMYILFSNVSLPPHLSPKQTTTWLPYIHKEGLKDKAWFEATCVGGSSAKALEDLPDIIDKWSQSEETECRRLYQMFTKMFHVTSSNGKVVISDTFAVKVKGWLGGKEDLFKEVQDQNIITLYNEYTREQNVYNPLRSKRPMSVPAMPERQYIEKLYEETKPKCDFCNFKSFTAEDVFGRVERKWSYSTSNTFKLDRWHALILFKGHHPHNWTQVQFLDVMETKQEWFDKVHSREKNYNYPSLVWDLLPHAGASQVHPHLHAFLDKDMYQGGMELWRRAAMEYNRDMPNQNFFSDLIQIHALFGLTVSNGKAVAFANLVPKKDNEMVFVGERADQDFHNLFYSIIRVYLDKMNKLCYSAGVAFPSMSGDTTGHSLPAFGRIVTRGAVADIRSDISSLELFGATNANTDPFQVIQHMRESIGQNTAKKTGR